MGETSLYKLYWSANTAAFAPEAVLEVGGLPYERVPIDLAGKETQDADYLAINPAGYLPALITPEGETIYESAAIVLYLCLRHRLDLVPSADSPELGRFYRSLFYMTNTVQEAYKLHYYPARFAGADADLDATRARALALLQTRWAVIEDLLAPAGPFFFGARMGALDIYLVMLVSWHPDESAFLAGFPAIKRCVDAAAKAPGLARVIARHRAA